MCIVTRKGYFRIKGYVPIKIALRLNPMRCLGWQAILNETKHSPNVISSIKPKRKKSNLI